MDNKGWGLINYREGDDSFPPSRDVAERWRNFGAASARTRQIAGEYYPEISSRHGGNTSLHGPSRLHLWSVIWAPCVEAGKCPTINYR